MLTTGMHRRRISNSISNGFEHDLSIGLVLWRRMLCPSGLFHGPEHDLTWPCTLQVPAVDSGLVAGEERRFPPECLRPVLGVSAPPKRTTAYDPF